MATKLNMVVGYRLIFICISACANVAKALQCSASERTVRPIDRCPQNLREWKAREKVLNCHLIQQDCVPASKFKYHCVLNEHGSLIEVCAPEKYIHGQLCAEFNSRGNLIQESPIKCSSNNCPSNYISTDAYRYQNCYGSRDKHQDQKKNGKKECRSGYKWNETLRLCQRCPLGYTGPECTFQCRFPSYGLDCFNTCDCSWDVCNFMFGCVLVDDRDPEGEIFKGQIGGTTSDNRPTRIDPEGEIFKGQIGGTTSDNRPTRIVVSMKESKDPEGEIFKGQIGGTTSDNRPTRIDPEGEIFKGQIGGTTSDNRPTRIDPEGEIFKGQIGGTTSDNRPTRID
uniref:Uncharacterized protein LOC111123429 isoform X2 n=1 Tax=Crassostrea virginica TaxID=6565 RepID=A0A8B8D0Z0_CRAVI|nr:uncharacterized protein LOC111123429 isoform X2 [Crassostrea virginica]